MLHFLWILIVGAIFGALARLFMKGDQGLSVVWTIILGALGAVAGSWIEQAIFGSESKILFWIFGIVMSVVFISIFLAATRGSKRV